MCRIFFSGGEDACIDTVSYPRSTTSTYVFVSTPFCKHDVFSTTSKHAVSCHPRSWALGADPMKLTVQNTASKMNHSSVVRTCPCNSKACHLCKHALSTQFNSTMTGHMSRIIFASSTSYLPGQTSLGQTSWNNVRLTTCGKIRPRSVAHVVRNIGGRLLCCVVKLIA